MARKKETKDHENFTIKCHNCGFSGTFNEFEIRVNVCDCGSCSGGAEITIECRKCHSEMEVESW